MAPPAKLVTHFAMAALELVILSALLVHLASTQWKEWQTSVSQPVLIMLLISSWTVQSANNATQSVLPAAVLRLIIVTPV